MKTAATVPAATQGTDAGEKIIGRKRSIITGTLGLLLAVLVTPPLGVERTFGWLMLHRRLARDYEALPARSEAMIHLAMIDLMTRRCTRESTPTWRGA